MPRARVYYKHEIPDTVIAIVRALCADYGRRKTILQFGNCFDKEILKKYKELQDGIDTALCGVEEFLRMNILKDIALKKGYDQSQICYCLTKTSYYHRKHKVIYDIAVALKLIEHKI